MSEQKREVVLILHGLGRTALSMMPLAWALRRAGYATETWTYNSLNGGLPDQIARLRQKLPRLAGYSKVHGVGHSLGGLMLRGLFTPDTGLPLGRVVFLGTPHKGAAVINTNPRLFNATTSPQIICDLKAGSPAIVRLGIPDAELGVIAGLVPFHPLNPVSWITQKSLQGAPHDGTVELSSAKLEHSLQDYLEVNANHSFMIWNPRVIKATVNFICEGRFV